MFTGLIQGLAPITGITAQPAGLRLRLDLGELAEGLLLGASVAVSGACLTVVRFEGTQADFDVSPETLSKTKFSSVALGDLLNVECSLAAGAPLGGHMVSGHVDGMGEFLSRETQGDYEVQRFRAPAEVADLLISKGSVTIDGVSLTVAELFAEGQFSVALIPETLSRTSLSLLREGDKVHMEGDMIGKFVFAYLERRGSSGHPVH